MKTCLVDSLQNLYPDSTVGRKPCTSMAVDVARGGTPAVHVLLNELTEGAAVRMTLKSKAATNCAQRFRLIDVPVEANTGPDGFIEKPGERNPYVVRRAPFRTYDAMAPVGATFKATNPTMALRLHVPIPAGARPGTQHYTIELRSKKQTAGLSLTVRVHKPVIPPVGRDSWPYTNWFSMSAMAKYHGLKEWSEAHWRMMRRYADLMVRCRQNTFLVSLGAFVKRVRGRLMLDVKRLRRIVKTFTDAGMYYIEGGHLASRTGGGWKAETFDLAFNGPRATSPAGNAELAHLAGLLMKEIRANGWQDRWIQHVTDEPTAENAADYRILAGMVHKYMPGIPIIDATMNTSLVGSLNIWCPQPQEYARFREEFEAQRAIGDRVWFYTCCMPGGPWLNRLLDNELLRPALLGWGAAHYKLDGFLHWAFNKYRADEDPFEKSVALLGGENWLPGGDTHVCYPGDDGPWSSLRLEAQREGIEDYEFLRRLQTRSPQAAAAIIAAVFRRFDRYTKKTATFREARRRLLEAL